MPAPHEMTLTSTPEPGADEWSCTQCGRRLLLRRPPAFETIVLERGDELAAHVGGTGGLQTSVTTEPRAHPVELPPADHGWLAAHGINWGPGDTGWTDKPS